MARTDDQLGMAHVSVEGHGVHCVGMWIMLILLNSKPNQTNKQCQNLVFIVLFKIKVHLFLKMFRYPVSIGKW